MPSVYTFAGQLDDPLAEEIVATLYSDQPVRSVERPTDSRRHWQWFAREPLGQTSRIWVGYAEPLTADSVENVQTRANAALARAGFAPKYADSVTATATQTAVDEIELEIVVARSGQTDMVIQLVIVQGEDEFA